MPDMPGSFGSYVDKDIIRQIEVRQCLQGRKKFKDGEKEKVFDEKDYQALYSNAPWICLRSSVDAPPVNSWKPNNKSNVTDTAARRYVLCGGTLEYGGMDGDKPKLKFADGPSIAGRAMAGYTQDRVTGYRPKPGITKMTVKTKDTFGCIMEADIDFMVYSLDELELVDQIYFKPGMTALVEWGHTTYHDSNGNLKYMSTSDLYSFDQFFKAVPYETIEKEVQNWRKFKKREAKVGEKPGNEGFCGNYEALYGYITNFSYSFNSNGSYTCKVKILSKGSILEGLQIPANTGCRMKQVEEEDSGEEVEESSIKTPFHRIFNKFKKEIENNHNDEAEGYRFTTHSIIFDEWDTGGPVTYKFCGKNMIQKRSFIFDDWAADGKTPMIYIKFDDFLQIVNKIVSEAHVDYVEFATRTKKMNDETGEYTSMPYVSFDEHFSLNPGVVVLPCRAIVHGEDYSTIPATKDSKGNELTVNDVLDKTNIGLPSGTLAAEDNVIADLMVNIDFILGVLDSIIDNETNEYVLKNLIDSVLEGMQKAMGNINNFGIQINEVTGKAEIIDRNCVAQEVAADREKDSPIIVSGTDTTVTELSITSEVSSETANSMAVAATAPDDGSSVANIDQVFWNEGCIDRHRRPEQLIKEEQAAYYQSTFGYDATQPGGLLIGAQEKNNIDKYGIVKGSAINEQNRQQAESDKMRKVFLNSRDFLRQVYTLYENFVDRKATEEAVSEDQSFSEFVESSFTNLQRDGETLFKRCVNRDILEVAGKEGTAVESSHFQSGIIPIKIGFTMKGIGRFIIGTTFKVSEGLVPRKYKDWKNIITGVEHTVDKNGWKTAVTALYYPVVVKARRPKGGGDNIPWEDPDEVNTSAAAITQSTVDQTNQLSNISKGNTSKFFKEYWSKRHQTKGACAKYCHDMARCWVGGKKTLNAAMQGSGYNAGDVYASTGKSLAVEGLSKLGWKLMYSKVVQANQIDGILRNLKSDLPGGSIVIYYMNYKPAKQVRPGVYLYGEYNGKSHYHVQMRAPEISSGWTTSTMDNYKCAFVYNGRAAKDKYSWTLHILTPPEMHSDWKA